MPNPDRYLLPEFDPDQEEHGGICGDDHEVTLVHEETNLRIIMDSDLEPTEDREPPPDVFIERHKDHWLIILHPDGGDPLVIMELYDKRLRLEYGRGRLSDVYETFLPLE